MYNSVPQMYAIHGTVPLFYVISIFKWQCFNSVLDIDFLGENVDFIELIFRIVHLNTIQVYFNSIQLSAINRTLSLVLNMIGNIQIRTLQLDISNELTLASLQNILTKINIIKIVLSLKITTSSSSSAINSGKSLLILITDLTTQLLNLGKNNCLLLKIL